MKKTVAAVCAAALSAVMLASCASTSGAGGTAGTGGTAEKSASPKAKYAVIDWNGAAFGSDAPAEWMEYAANGDLKAFESSEAGAGVRGKFYVIVSGVRSADGAEDTKSLRLLQENVTAQYATEIARDLNQAVDARFSGVLSEDEEDQQTLTATAAKARFTGFAKACDGWLLRQNRADDSYQYSYIAVYACDKDMWEQQCADYIRRFGLTAKSENMKKAVSMADDLASELSDPATFAELSAAGE